jgi:hypothetical protein
MLIILIAAAWIALMLFGVAVCRMAALGDSTRSEPAADPGRVVHSGLVVWDEPEAQGKPRQPRPNTRHRHITLHGLR